MEDRPGRAGPLGPAPSAADAGTRSKQERVVSGAGTELRLVVPDKELRLTPGAAGVLLRILLKAVARAKQPQTVREQQR